MIILTKKFSFAAFSKQNYLFIYNEKKVLKCVWSKQKTHGLSNVEENIILFSFQKKNNYNVNNIISDDILTLI